MRIAFKAKKNMKKGNCKGILVLTLSEAEQFAAAGIDDIYLANQSAFVEWEPITIRQKFTGLEFKFHIWKVVNLQYDDSGQGIVYLYIQNHNFSGCDPADCPGSISELLGGPVTIEDSWYLDNQAGAADCLS